MDMDRHKMAERILHLTLEILFRLTGEDYTVVKKTSSERCQDPMSEERRRPLSPIMGPPPHPFIHEDINDQKILELTYKMIELLTGEVPIRCQDVAVYFSMEEWEYLKGHKDLYKDIMMEVPQPLTSPDLSSKRTTPERCPHPLLPQDCKQEDPNVPQDHQGEDLTHINTTETYVRGDEWCKEEIPTYDYPARRPPLTAVSPGGSERCAVPACAPQRSAVYGFRREAESSRNIRFGAGVRSRVERTPHAVRDFRWAESEERTSALAFLRSRVERTPLLLYERGFNAGARRQ
ncbi:gastrula zinc finger protein XlCGF53.1-like [Phyllobates terribilis]|uniref:gastrula zinc finger protein XlCGF53.1-like n=1 Tax=Phyllobates terribilis TaxID=111132 RepID=UPI003CCA869C